MNQCLSKIMFDFYCRTYHIYFQDYVGSGDYGTDDEDYDGEYYNIDYDNGNDEYYSVNVEPVIDNDANGNIDFEEGSEAISDLVIRITLQMKSPWNDALGKLCYENDTLY